MKHRLLVWILGLSVLVAIGCGGESEDEADSNEQALSWEDIAEQADAINHCETAADCGRVQGFNGCDSVYVNAGEDTQALQAAIAEKNDAAAGEDLACTADCRCGQYACNEGKCEGVPSTCDFSGEEPSELFICL